MTMTTGIARGCDTRSGHTRVLHSRYRVYHSARDKSRLLLYNAVQQLFYAKARREKKMTPTRLMTTRVPIQLSPCHPHPYVQNAAAGQSKTSPRRPPNEHFSFAFLPPGPCGSDILPPHRDKTGDSLKSPARPLAIKHARSPMPTLNNGLLIGYNQHVLLPHSDHTKIQEPHQLASLYIS